MRNVKMCSLLTQRVKRGLRRQSVRGKEEKKLAERQRVKAVERERKKEHWQTANSMRMYWHKLWQTQKKKWGKSERVETEGVKDSQPESERVTERSPERARVCGWMWERHLRLICQSKCMIDSTGPSHLQSPLALPGRLQGMGAHTYTNTELTQTHIPVTWRHLYRLKNKYSML